MRTSSLFAVIIAATTIACNSSDNKKTVNSDTASALTRNEPAKSPLVKVDPVCDMEKDGTWTDFSLNNSDTVWFCSATCKNAFEGNRKKYQAKITNR